MPASAETTAGTPTAVTVGTGVLSITVPVGAALPTVAPGTNSTVTLGDTTVTDTRAGETGWSATVTLPALVGVAVATRTIPTTTATYLASTAGLTGSPTLDAPATRTDLSNSKVSQTASAVSGNNTATWTGALMVPIPAQVLADEYRGTLTQSVS